MRTSVDLVFAQVPPEATLMAWALLVIAGLAEIAWVVQMRTSRGFSLLWPSVAAVLISIVSFVLLGLAMKTLPMGTSYAVWTGIGVVGASIAGIILFQESASPLRLACIALIVVGMVGLRLTGGE
jgi:quaternary ammonium compound-resistance protein SugE